MTAEDGGSARFSKGRSRTAELAIASPSHRRAGKSSRRAVLSPAVRVLTCDH